MSARDEAPAAPKRKKPTVLFVLGCATLSVLAVGFVGIAWLLLSGPSHFMSEGKGPLGPGDCRTALAQTTSCAGEDTSFQECHYRFRAEGVPSAPVCAAFLASAAGGPAPVDAGSGCLETSPGEWTEVACASVHIETALRCFRCVDATPEAARVLVQAFDARCERGVVLKSCNQALP